jgi:uncharacterized cofD-like protein
MKTTDTRIVTMGGGSGQFVLLSGLRHLQQVTLTAVVSMVDSGGSTGRLRDELGILPPGDVLKCILALSPHQEVVRTLLLKRFQGNGRLEGHNAGNMLLTMLSRYTGNFPAGIQALAQILDVKGTILPVTVDRATLVAELTDGSHIYGERAIDVPRGTQREKIQKVFLVPHHSDDITVYPPVLEAIASADYIILGPGDLFTSVIPNLVVPEVKEALMKTPARLLYVLNIMTKFGETHHFTAREFVNTIERWVGRKVDGLIYNTTRPNEKILQRYADQKSEFVTVDHPESWRGHRTFYGGDLLDTGGDIARHDPAKLAALIRDIVAGKTR